MASAALPSDATRRSAGEGDVLLRPAVFLDRDGVLNANRDDYVKSWDEFEFLPGVAPSLRILRDAGFALVVVTNQSMVGRGRASEEALHDIHRRMVEALAERGASVDGVFYCAHTPDDACACRKPEPGLLRDAARLLRLDLARSVMVGDRESDLEAGRRAGVGATYLVSRERPLWKVARAVAGRP